MGVATRSECDGHHRIEYQCYHDDCDTDSFWADETMSCVCPGCHYPSFVTNE